MSPRKSTPSAAAAATASPSKLKISQPQARRPNTSSTIFPSTTPTPNTSPNTPSYQSPLNAEKNDQLPLVRPSIIGPALRDPYPYYEIRGSAPATSWLAAVVTSPSLRINFCSRFPDPARQSNIGRFSRQPHPDAHLSRLLGRDSRLRRTARRRLVREYVSQCYARAAYTCRSSVGLRDTD